MINQNPQPTDNGGSLESQYSLPYPALPPDSILFLQNRGCRAQDWSRVHIHPLADLSLINDVEFEGDVTIGMLNSAKWRGCGISYAVICDSVIGDGVRIRDIHGRISGALIEDEAVIENCSQILFDRQPLCGVGLRIAVLDETGSREVMIYPGLSAQSAMLMARAKRVNAEEIYMQTQDYIDHLHLVPRIGRKAVIRDCGKLHNVHVDPYVTVEGARSLTNGSIFNNVPETSEPLAYIGAGTDADGFIIEDGSVESGALLRNCFVGQGVRLEKGFTAHDSLFFANCVMENGEACALFAGPYTVSVHKATLLIGCQTSFMNAGSCTNQSNHMYKLGPIHWGVLERGVKSSSGSYLMLGANIGAFSLLMGSHKTHPDSKEFPFSYLFGDPQGATVVVPAVMLRSCGLLRDELKWPDRDRRVKAGVPLRDRIIFDVLNPVTVNAMIDALSVIRPMLSRPADDDRYHRYKGMKLSRASLDRAMKLYYLGIMKYLAKIFFPDGTVPEDWHFPDPPGSEEERERDAAIWTDLAGQPMPRPVMREGLHAESVTAREEVFDKAFADYREMELRWIAARFPEQLRPDAQEILQGAAELNRIIELDRATYRDSISAESAMLAL